LLIYLPFQLGGTACRDNSDVFNAGVSFLLGMGHQQQGNPARQAHRLPALLTVFYPVMARDMQRVIEHELGSGKTYAVLVLVALVFGLIP
jgi:hypothetical protein